MIKNMTVIAIGRQEKTYQFHCEKDASLGEIFDVLCEMRGIIVQKMHEYQLAEQQKVQESPKETQE